jgi:hypothetical protein
MTEPSLKILAEVEDSPAIFMVDDEEYEIHDFRYMTDKDEIEFSKLQSRERRWNRQVRELSDTLFKTSDDKKADELEKQIDALKEKLGEVRVDYICMLTTMPKEVCRKLKLYDKGRILEAITKISNDRMATKGDGQDPNPFPEDETGSGSRSVSISD